MANQRAAPEGVDVKKVREHISKFAQAQNGTAWMHLILTCLGMIIIPFFYGRIPMILRPLLCVLHGLFAVKCFVVFHDCGHGSFFSTAALNNLGHQITSKVVFTPCFWQSTHNQHHAHSANMDQDEYGFNETVFHTVREYKAMSAPVRFIYRILRDPLIFYAGGSFFKWFMYFNLPFIVNPDYPPMQCVANLSATIIYASIVCMSQPQGMAVTALLCSITGWWLGATIGVALFHTQHSFNPAYVRKTKDTWSHTAAGLQGSSVAYIPKALKWFSMGIEYHHLHHFSTKIPGYRLQECHETCPKDLLKDTVIMTPEDMWASMKNVLYDDELDRFVNFAELK